MPPSCLASHLYPGLPSEQGPNASAGTAQEEVRAAKIEGDDLAPQTSNTPPLLAPLAGAGCTRPLSLGDQPYIRGMGTLLQAGGSGSLE